MSDPAPLAGSIATHADRTMHLRFELEADSRGLHHQAYRNWPAAPDQHATDIGNPLLVSATYPDYSDAVWQHENGIAYICVDHGSMSVRAAAKSPFDALTVIDAVRKLLPPYESEDPAVVPVTFWTSSPMGANQLRRDVDAASWEAIAENYPSTAGLDELMDPRFRPGLGGQLLLWHGHPGTGKTTALRALAHEWRDWCDVHYIVDPDTFFGSRADYMMHVMTAPDEGKVGGEPRWRLLVLEDCGELLQPDAKREVGQALARLLNACDGLIGRGLRILVLVTTNEEAGNLHEAVSRPGRCAARVEFKAFRPIEANDWLEGHGGEREAWPAGAATLADLYGRLQGFRERTTERKVGFAA